MILPVQLFIILDANDGLFDKIIFFYLINFNFKYPITRNFE